MRFVALVTIGLLALTGCSGADIDKGGGTSTSTSGENGCANGSALSGATYDIAKSHFAFGSNSGSSRRAATLTVSSAPMASWVSPRWARLSGA